MEIKQYKEIQKLSTEYFEKAAIAITDLEKENIEARHIWKPMHLQPFFAKYDYIGEDKAEKIFTTGLCLPSDTKMTEEDLARVTKTLKEIWM